MALWDSCVGKWKLANATWTDSSGNGNTLTASASAPTAVAGFGGTASAAANFVRASSQYLTITDAAQVGLDLAGVFSFAARIKLVASNDGNFYMIFSKLGASGFYAYDFYISSAGKLVARFSPNGTSLFTTTGATTLTAGVWYSVMAVYDNSTLKVYLNNVEDGTSTPGAQTLYNSSIGFYIGMSADGSSHKMNGVIDDGAIWAKALSSAERAEYQALTDNFTIVGTLSGIVRDKNGTVINCSTYNTRINVYAKNNSTAAPLSSQLVTSSNGAWTATGASISPGTKCLVTFEYEGNYLPTSDIDIAGAEFITAV